MGVRTIEKDALPSSTPAPQATQPAFTDPEPAKGEPGTCTIRFVFPNNKRVTRNFYLTDTLNTFMRFLATTEEAEQTPKRLVAGRPSQNLLEHDLNTPLMDFGFRNDVVRIDYE